MPCFKKGKWALCFRRGRIQSLEWIRLKIITHSLSWYVKLLEDYLREARMGLADRLQAL